MPDPDDLPAFLPGELEIVQVDVEELNHYRGNPRTITAEAFEQLKGGLEAFGFVKPIIVRAENNVVVGGNQRLKAAKELGFESVPCVMLEGLEKEEADALNVLLNNEAAQGRFEPEKLQRMLDRVRQAEGVDETTTGFNADQLEEHLSWQGDDPGGSGGGDAPEGPQEEPDDLAGPTFEVLVLCESEEEQRKLKKRLTDEGFNCRSLTA